VVFQIGEARYRTTGESVGEGGMGMAYLVERRLPGKEPVAAVAKVFREEFLAQVYADPPSRRHFEHHLHVLERLREIDDIHVMPVYGLEPICDNQMVLAPFLGQPLIELLAEDRLSHREGVATVLQAVRGLRTLHRHGIVHGDFTPNNILMGDPKEHAAVVFDFDLSVVLDHADESSYLDYYEQRIVGSPLYSIPPEHLDPVLLHSPVSIKKDIYAVGTALFSLFTDAPVYGDAPDLPSLLQRISDGVVRHGISKVEFPSEVPRAIREVINRCLERDPAQRFDDTDELVRHLERAHKQMSARGRSRFRTTLAYGQGIHQITLDDVVSKRKDDSVSGPEIRQMQGIMHRYGYVLEMSLGRVKGHAIYVAAPQATLVAQGRFVGDNAYRKIVTAIDLGAEEDSEQFVADWLGRIKPILDSVRMTHLTALHRVALDRPAQKLLLFSEYLDDPRFGTALLEHELTLHEALGLGVIVVDQVARLHEHGLAHNNVTFESLLFKGFPETGEARPAFVGLVAPSFSVECMAEDVYGLAGIVHSLISLPRVEELPENQRGSIDALRRNLDAIATGAVEVPPIAGLFALICEGLSLIEDNFGVVASSGGDPIRFAHLLVERSLYRRLWKSKP
jgi:serine/threonine protein kinase